MVPTAGSAGQDVGNVKSGVSGRLVEVGHGVDDFPFFVVHAAVDAFPATGLVMARVAGIPQNVTWLESSPASWLAFCTLAITP